MCKGDLPAYAGLLVLGALILSVALGYARRSRGRAKATRLAAEPTPQPYAAHVYESPGQRDHAEPTSADDVPAATPAHAYAEWPSPEDDGGWHRQFEPPAAGRHHRPEPGSPTEQ